MLKKVIKAVIFLIIFSSIILCISYLFRLDSAITKAEVQGFYAETPNTLDAVYIGPSSVYRYWQAPIAWNDFGITVLDYSTSSQPRAATKYVIKECLKTQNPQVIIIDVRSFAVDEDIGMLGMHHLLDFMPFSTNKIELTTALCDELGLGLLDRTEYFFPFVRFHTRWKTLTMHDFIDEPSNIKNALTDPYFVKTSKGNDDLLYFTGETMELSESSLNSLNDLLDYCDTLTDTNVLFVSSPFLENAERKMRINKIGDILTSRGYDFINFNDQNLYELIGIIANEDYQDSEHLNASGSLKYTHYLASILKDQYSLADKRDNSKYASWDNAYGNYMRYIITNTVDLKQYLNYVRNDRYSIFIAVKGEASGSLKTDILNKLSELGLKESLESKYGYSYIAIIDKGALIFEDIGLTKLSISGKLSGGLDYSVISAGTPIGNNCSIILNGKEYAINSNGLNIVVYDNELQGVIDMVCFDSSVSTLDADRINQ